MSRVNGARHSGINGIGKSGYSPPAIQQRHNSDLPLIYSIFNNGNNCGKRQLGAACAALPIAPPPIAERPVAQKLGANGPL